MVLGCHTPNQQPSVKLEENITENPNNTSLHHDRTEQVETLLEMSEKDRQKSVPVGKSQTQRSPSP